MRSLRDDKAGPRSRFTTRWTRAGLVLVMVGAGLALAGSTASAAPVAIELCAKPGTVSLPGAPGTPIWGFGIPSTPGDCGTATASLPGPLLVVNVGDTVTIDVGNALPAGRTLDLDIPGISLDPGPTTAPPGASVSISFTASAPGTYLYESGGDSGRQEAMGLSGALIVRPATTGRAYADPSTAYDVEAVLVLDAIDPAFNAAPMTSDLKAFLPTYWLVNGTTYPNTGYPNTDGILATPGQRVLLRYLNAGFDNTSMELLGMHETVVAKDAHPVPQQYDAVAETIPAGATEDTIATMPAFAPPSSNGFPLFNRQVHLTNGDQTGTSPTPAAGGGMLVFIHS